MVKSLTPSHTDSSLPPPVSFSLSHTRKHTAPRITSFTIDGSRFLTNSDTRTLTCNYQALNSTVEWLRNNQILIDTSDSIISMSLGQSTLTVSMFEPQGGVMADLFECVVSNRVGGVISEAIGLVEAPSGTDMPGSVCVLFIL